MQIFLVTIAYVLLFIYMYLFIRQTPNVFHKLYKNKQENLYEEVSFKLFSIYKITSYIVIFLVLTIGILIAQRVELNLLLYLYYFLWLISLLTVKLHISLIDHLTNVLFVKESVVKLEKECLVGAIKQENNRYYFIYRLKKEKIYLT